MTKTYPMILSQLYHTKNINPNTSILQLITNILPCYNANQSPYFTSNTNQFINQKLLHLLYQSLPEPLSIPINLIPKSIFIYHLQRHYTNILIDDLYLLQDNLIDNLTTNEIYQACIKRGLIKDLNDSVKQKEYLISWLNNTKNIYKNDQHNKIITLKNQKQIELSTLIMFLPSLLSK